MGRITGLEPLRESGDRVAVYVDGERVGSLGAATLARSGLREGDAFDPAAWEELQRVHEGRLAFERALKYLEARMRSRKEAADDLRARGFSLEAAGEALRKLEEYGYVDDAAFAREWVRGRMAAGRRGRAAIEQELVRKGVGRDMIARALEDYAPEAEEENARAEYERLRRRCGQTGAAARRKIGEAMLRRGYPWDIVSGLLERMGEEDPKDINE